jgi:hypothetical protein
MLLYNWPSTNSNGLLVTTKCCKLKILILLPVCLPVQPAGDHFRGVVLFTREALSYSVLGIILGCNFLFNITWIMSVCFTFKTLARFCLFCFDTSVFLLFIVVSNDLILTVPDDGYSRHSLNSISTLLPKQYVNLHGLSCIGRKIETQSLTLHVSQRQTLSHKVISSTLCHGQ